MGLVILSVENLSLTLQPGGRRVLDAVSFELRRSEILCVIGESGAGKSMLASALLGAVDNKARLEAQTLRLGNRDLIGLTGQEWQKIRGRYMGFVAQEPASAFNPMMTIGAQIDEVLKTHSALTSLQRKQRVLALLFEMQLEAPERIAASFVHQISGGQAQRAMIAMALACEPAVIIADEPTASL